MKNTIYLITLIVIVLTASGCRQENVMSAGMKPQSNQPEPSNAPLYSDRIKNATLLIQVESIQPDGVTMGLDMGTLVQYHGDTYLVTHNHYGEMLGDTNILELRDAQNQLIRTMYGSEFKSLIIYQDPGTLVLRAPEGLTETLIPVSIDNQPQLQSGDIVQVAYRGGAERAAVEILDAVIEEITLSRETPVYKLRFPNGQLLSPGDSGGGVWYGGTLVGNNWLILMIQTIEVSSGTIQPASETQTPWSYAAILPDIFR